MKRQLIIPLSLVLLTVLIAFTSCRRQIPGPQGPRGAQGPQGPEGPGAFMWETPEFNFSSSDNSYLWKIPDNFEPLNTDKMLVYLLWEIDGEFDVWKPMPITVFKNGGTMQYANDFTMYDVKMYIQASHDSLITAADRNGWFARIVLIPTDFQNSAAKTEVPEYADLEKEYRIIANPQQR